jgi:transposase InsO family protein
MPWTETCVVENRAHFIASWLQDHDVAGLARHYGISRKTAYKWIDRYQEEGRRGLVDRSRRPHQSPQATNPALVSSLLGLRRLHPTWGPKKLLAKLSQQGSWPDLPAISTASDILKRAGLVTSPRRRRRLPEVGGAWPRGDAPNAIWCVDYKGEFRLGDGRYCYPLTVSDEYSRYLLVCQGFPRIAREDAQRSFERAFRTYGLPEAIRSDNGCLPTIRMAA